MTVLSVFLIAFFLLISWLLCWEVYRGTEQDLPHVHRYRRISPGYSPHFDHELGSVPRPHPELLRRTLVESKPEMRPLLIR